MYRLDSAMIRHWPAATLVVTLTAGWHRRECEKNAQEREREHANIPNQGSSWEWLSTSNELGGLTL